jgi:hypothetical protein
MLNKLCIHVIKLCSFLFCEKLLNFPLVVAMIFSISQIKTGYQHVDSSYETKQLYKNNEWDVLLN